jgi:hypothetical protein
MSILERRFWPDKLPPKTRRNKTKGEYPYHVIGRDDSGGKATTFPSMRRRPDGS